eukprot:6327003-Prymnesium_polylepis.1
MSMGLMAAARRAVWRCGGAARPRALRQWCGGAARPRALRQWCGGWGGCDNGARRGACAHLEHLAHILEDAVRLEGAARLVLHPLLVLSHRDLRLGEDREEHGEHDEDGDEEVAEEEQRVEPPARVAHDLVN